MLVGQTNLWMGLEFFYWLQRVRYDGWCVLDFFPYREDGLAALAQCIRNTQRMLALSARLCKSPLPALQESADPVAISELLWSETIQL